jgi:endonuclease YncB( thermonuclease family)
LLRHVAAALRDGARDPIAAPDIYIIDGDTIAVRGKRIRFVGFDAPELGGHHQA